MTTTTITATARVGFDHWGRAIFPTVEVLDTFSGGRFAHIRILDPSQLPVEGLVDRETIANMSESGGLATPVATIRDASGSWSSIPVR